MLVPAMTIRRGLMTSLAVFFLAGCTGIGDAHIIMDMMEPVTQPTPPQWQRMADQVTKRFGAMPVTVEERPNLQSWYVCREFRILLGAKRPDVRLSLAHELGHHIRRDCGQSVMQELEANALAVQVLQVWGETPEEAVRLMVQKLYQARSVATVHVFCTELMDMLHRYPTAADPRKPGECGV